MKADENFTLPGVAEDSTIMRIYRDLKAGRVLTSLDAINEYKTVNLVKYLSDLRLKYGVPVKDRWIDLESGKRCKRYWVDQA
jgi:hypothetical protein